MQAFVDLVLRAACMHHNNLIKLKHQILSSCAWVINV